jgi:hypothetical protein
MTMRPIKLRPQDPNLPARALRLRLAGRLAADLDAYREIYAHEHGRTIELSAMIEGILEQFLATDRGFRRWRAESQARETRGSDAGDRDA